jgi:hypothetical protein
MKKKKRVNISERAQDYYADRTFKAANNAVVVAAKGEIKSAWRDGYLAGRRAALRR